MAQKDQVLDGKYAVVTGGGRGIGRGVSLALAKAGAGVAILELDAETGPRTADEITELGGRAVALAGSVRDASDCAAIVARAVDEFGGVDILVNNAQQVPMGPLSACTDDDMFTAWESGTLATFRLMNLCYPVMKARGGGSIVNLGSGAGTEGVVGLAAYAAAKEGIRGLTKVAAKEWGPDGIRVNTVCPWASSDYWERLPDAQRQAQLRHNPLRRIGDCEADVGAMVVFLASDAASYVTAQTVMVDGGNMGFR
jgi:meso-butanediol dehydrogenase / (S,S)-butanediol dehydrogenase / diacetyl reductase